MGTVTIIDQATMQIGRGMAYTEAVRQAFWEKFGLRLEVDPGFVDDYNYCVRAACPPGVVTCELSPPQAKWIEGFRDGWLRYQVAVIEWQKDQEVLRKKAIGRRPW